MTALCGWIGDALAAPETTLASMGHKLGGANLQRSASHTPQGALLTAALHQAPQIASTGQLRASVIGKPQFADAALRQLAQQQGPAAALLAGYRQYGAKVLQQLHDRFCIVVLDLAGNKALLAVDRFASINLAYCQHQGALAFATSLKALTAHPALPHQVDPQAIYHYLYFHMIPGPGTIYREQQRLQPGECLLWQNGEIRLERYWQPLFEEHHSRPFDEQKARFIELLQQGVKDAAAGAETGCFLSGGTDSSTIAGMLTRVSGKPARTFSIGFEAEGYDEMEFARLAVKQFGTQHTEYYVTPDDVVAGIPLIAASADQPFGNSSAVPGYFCALKARGAGIERMLGGDGGDELFGGNARYAKQRVFEHYARVPAGLRRHMLEPLIRKLPAAFPLAGKARSYIEQANTPLPARLETYNLLERFGVATVLHPDLLAQIDANGPGKHQQRTWQQTNAETLVNRMLALDFKYTLADNDLVKVNLACEVAGVDIGYPLLSDALTDVSLSLDPDWKLKGNQLRWFFKEALRGFLPDEIISKEKHGFGLPFGPWLRKHAGLQQLVRGSLEDLKRHNIVRPDFIDTVMKSVEIHPGYYGTMVWILMMLSQWYAHNEH